MGYAARLVAFVALAFGVFTVPSAQAKNACVLAQVLRDGVPAPVTPGRVVLPARYCLACGQPVPAAVLAADPTVAG